MTLSELSDENLMLDAANGRIGAFEEILQRHHGRVLNFLWRFSGSEEKAKVLFESTWAELFQMRGSQAAAQGTQTLLFSIATRKAMRQTAEQASWARALGAGNPGDRASLAWRSARLNDALLRLPARERAALLLCFFDSLNYAAAAECLNEREENLRSICGQGLGRLLESLGEGFMSAGLP